MRPKVAAPQHAQIKVHLLLYTYIRILCILLRPTQAIKAYGLLTFLKGTRS